MNRFTVILLAGLLSGCLFPKSPLPVERRYVQPPQQGQVLVAARATRQVGAITPVDINVSNGLPGRIRVEASQVFAVTQTGQWVAPIPNGEAIKLAGDAVQLESAMKSALATAAVGAALGAAAGAGIGAGGGAIAGAAIGAAAGGAVAGSGGMEAGKEEAARQIAELSLHDRYIETHRSINGYVFFPPGPYTGVAMLVVDEEEQPTTINTVLTEAPRE